MLVQSRETKTLLNNQSNFTLPTMTTAKRMRKTVPGASGCLEDYKRCTRCETLLLASSASGVDGKKDDALALPACSHALHAECLRRWYYENCTPQQQALLNRRSAPRYQKDLRVMAATAYADAFAGRCESCPRGESASAQ